MGQAEYDGRLCLTEIQLTYTGGAGKHALVGREQRLNARAIWLDARRP